MSVFEQDDQDQDTQVSVLSSHGTQVRVRSDHLTRIQVISDG